MTKKHWSLFFLIGFLCTAHAQEIAIEKYREDQIYLGGTFLSIIRNQSEFFQRGISSHFQIGFIRDMPISKDGQWAFGLGFGYSTTQYNSNLLRIDPKDQDKIEYQLSTNTVTGNSMSFGFQSIELPIEFRWRTSSPTAYQFWRIYGGTKFLWNFSGRTKFEGQNTSILSEINRLSNEVFLSFGYNTWNFYLAYETNAVLTDLSIVGQEKNLRINALKLGLIFFLL